MFGQPGLFPWFLILEIRETIPQSGKRIITEDGIKIITEDGKYIIAE